MFALGASIDLFAQLGIKKIQDRALSLNKILTTRLIDSGGTVLSPLGEERMRSAETLVSADDPAGLVTKLAARKIIVTKKPQGIRVATHFFNNEDDIERLIEALAAENLPPIT
jgi:selenocysteine lyase/cysteine desulfurase